MRRFLLATLIALLGALPPPPSPRPRARSSAASWTSREAPFPGVTVEARGPSLQGVRTSVSDASGTYRLVLLPPGAYKVTATLPGFARSEETVTGGAGEDFDGGHPAAGRRPGADRRLPARRPVVDTTSTAVGSNFDNREIRTLPTGRNYSSDRPGLPGRHDAELQHRGFANTITVYGSTGPENGFIIDGVDTTGIEYGSQGKELNFEFIQEVDVKTGGYEAEFGRSTGGIINVITKSGGNEFHGDVFGYYDADSLQAENKHPNDNLYGTVPRASRSRTTASTSAATSSRTSSGSSAPTTGSRTRHQRAAGRPASRAASSTVRERPRPRLRQSSPACSTESNTLVGGFFQDPREDTGAINDGAHTLNGAPVDVSRACRSSAGRTTRCATTGSRRQLGRHRAVRSATRNANSVAPATAAGDRHPVPRLARTTTSRSGGFGLIQDKEFERDFYGGSMTKYLGNHEIKARPRVREAGSPT